MSERIVDLVLVLGLLRMLGPGPQAGQHPVNITVVGCKPQRTVHEITIRCEEVGVDLAAVETVGVDAEPRATVTGVESVPAHVPVNAPMEGVGEVKADIPVSVTVTERVQ